jgi:hypothetical protein
MSNRASLYLRKKGEEAQAIFWVPLSPPTPTETGPELCRTRGAFLTEKLIVPMESRPAGSRTRPNCYCRPWGLNWGS